ncbi:ogr/Delta-like zinc finger family protein [Burkholderia pseudomallei]|uniref:ogr/Delta-like zinc finger family protein n=1 Tax=Burkholderia pseudomallei TaxID=28450 RepID=UPI0005313728|nr:ogr/Delta-like zinc finger family protein [Burkholderia pseudomallei]KGS27160.1 ogr/Delta-like zinc finger family protein [Burkholderia pseudomallei MSHR4378]KGW19286.1 ogr/Delta-like zinc finger family protein [Burkholderia pseudomallei MSHR4303]KGW88397.1 ogr/Delta-like zinc finger family protein [Burkholderia pseudomallei MSHR456]KGX33939.1 ogr/Delta-like zinc finger family protein [Burkholderia pseudomallei MSHR3335]KKB66378.1 ogr/Delta-like zinc finger family protein [Burkholderia pseu
MTHMTIECPCCGGEIEARHTEAMSATLRRLYFVCDDCGFRTPAGLEILFSLSPSARPRPGVALEVRPSERLRGFVDSRTTLRLMEAAK